jgi:hypothetical protein
MWQDLRDYWLPMMLFTGALVLAIVLIALVVAMPLAIDHVPALPLLDLFAADATVRRTAMAGAVGLLVTAFVFFRPRGGRKPSNSKPPQDTMAGA